MKRMQREGERRKRPKVGGGDEPERESSENKNTAPTYSARADAACSSGASLTPRGVTALLWTGHPTSSLSFLAIFHHSWKWDPARSASQSVAIAVTLPPVSCELQLLPPSLFSSSAHANTESCQNRHMPESKIAAGKEHVILRGYNGFSVYLFIYISLWLVISGFLIFIFPSTF